LAQLKLCHQVFNLLKYAKMFGSRGGIVGLPDPAPILPYLGLFTLVILEPDEVSGCRLLTIHLPNLSILEGSSWVPAPSATPADARHVARIFDPLARSPGAISLGYIPLSPQDLEFQQQRYWRLPLDIGAVLAALIVGVGFGPNRCTEISLVKDIAAILDLESRGTLSIISISRLPQADPNRNGGDDLSSYEDEPNGEGGLSDGGHTENCDEESSASNIHQTVEGAGHPEFINESYLNW
jgi:hypothetical protein